LAETPRILELRRRVQSDPSSIAFAQLAEEHRRAGNYDEAISCCRTGLTRHPGYLSARVTLGRALMETGVLDEAAREFDLVLRSAPDNLAAIRGLAEIHQRRGALQPALDYYKRALALAQHDPELAEAVSQIARELGSVAPSSSVAGMSFAQAHSELLSAASRMPEPSGASEWPGPETPGAAPEPTPTPPTQPLVDFDALLQSLGVPDAAPPPAMAALLNDPVRPAVGPEPVAPEVPPEPDIGNPFAALERALRAFDEGHATPTSASAPETPKAPATPAVLDELEAWLEALASERRTLPNRPWQDAQGERTERQTS
jgi:tetratricopeptide (TPR) repeat protein